MLGELLVIFILSSLLVILGKLFFPKQLTLLESVGLFLGSLVLASIILSCTFYANVHDVDILNGKVTGKVRVVVPCEHSYQCMCVTKRVGKTTERICQTCYRHPYDVNWVVKSTIGNFDIDRVDSQGLIKPHRYTIAKIGGPVSREESITNYIKASPNSLFNIDRFKNDNSKWKNLIPKYPSVYDYYRFHHVIALGFNYPLLNKLNKKISKSLESLGSYKQVNIMIVLIKSDNKNYVDVLERHWLGGKKNDVVVVLGTPNYPQLGWARAFTFAKSFNNSLLTVKLRDDLNDIKDVTNIDGINDIVTKDVMRYYNREPMKNFKYLMHDYTPSTTSTVISLIIYVILFGGLYIFFLINDVRN